MTLDYLHEVILVQIKMGGYVYHFCKSGRVYKLRIEGKKHEIVSFVEVDDQ